MLGRLAFCVVASLTLWACGSDKPTTGEPVLRLWQHQTGPEETAANKAMIARFNAFNTSLRVDEQSIPQGSYPQSILAAAMAGRLPCILTVDSPMVPAFVWAGHIQPLDQLVDRTAFAGIAPAALASYNGHIYAVGQFDAALAIFTRKSTLAEVGARVPTLEKPWTRQEFDKLLADLKATARWQAALDLGTREANPNWWTYAFSPMLQSFGGDLLDRRTLRTAEGALNGPEAQAWASWFRSLFAKGYVRRAEPDDQSLTNGRVALAYTGNWRAPDYQKAFGEDLLILPPPDLGNGAVIGGGSWQWAISSSCPYPREAASFIQHVISTSEIAAMSTAAGMVPVTEAAAQRTEKFRTGGDWRVFYELSRAFARPRPATPAFPKLSAVWYRAARDIMDGVDPQDALDDAVDEIDQSIRDNGNYVLSEGGGR